MLRHVYHVLGSVKRAQSDISSRVSHCAALEGISYLAVVGIAGWSLYTKITTGKGLPAGPAGTAIYTDGYIYGKRDTGFLFAGI